MCRSVETNVQAEFDHSRGQRACGVGVGSDGVGVDVAVGGDDAVSGGGAGDGGACKRECNGSDSGKAREGYESSRDGQVGVVDGGHGGVDDGSDGGVDERGDKCSSSRQICPLKVPKREIFDSVFIASK